MASSRTVLILVALSIWVNLLGQLSDESQWLIEDITDDAIAEAPSDARGKVTLHQMIDHNTLLTSRSSLNEILEKLNEVF